MDLEHCYILYLQIYTSTNSIYLVLPLEINFFKCLLTCTLIYFFFSNPYSYKLSNCVKNIFLADVGLTCLLDIFLTVYVNQILIFFIFKILILFEYFFLEFGI
jgi:hypothetical protein